MKSVCLLALEVESPVQPRPAPVEAPEGGLLPLPEILRAEDAPPRPLPPPETPPPRLPSLWELAHVLRLERYQRRRCRELQRQLLDVQVVAAKSVRLARTASSVCRVLAECIKAEDKPSFVSLFNSFHRALEDCGPAVPGFAAADPDVQWERSDHAEPFLRFLSDPHCRTIANFLTKVRYDGEFIANRLASLSQKEILSVLPDRGSSKFPESVLGAVSGTHSRGSRFLGLAVDAQTDIIESQCFGSVLETLIHAAEGFSGTHSEFESRRALDVWSTVCARLIAEQKPGSEKLVPAVLDVWATSSHWPGKERLNLWVLQTLRSGSFLTEQQNRQSFRMRIQTRPETPAEETVKAENFYTDAANSLIELMADSTGASVIPEAALRMARAIWEKLQPFPGHQRFFPHFVLTRWLFSSFFSDAVTLPEAFGLVSDCYISESARHRILREVARHAQKAVFDVAYAWKIGNYVPADLVMRVEAVMKRFQSHPIGPERPSRGQRTFTAPMESDSFLIVSLEETIKMVNALYPSRRPASFTSDGDIFQSGLQSSASSISGFSLFPNANGSEQVSAFPQWPQDASHSLNPIQNEIAEAFYPDEDGLDTERLREAAQVLEELRMGRTSSANLWATFNVIRGTVCHEAPVESSMIVSDDADRYNQPGKQSSAIHRCRSIVEQLLTDERDDFAGWHASAGPLEIYDALEDALQQRMLAAQESSDFVAAHAWFADLNSLRETRAKDATFDNLRQALGLIEAQSQDVRIRMEVSIDACDAWLRIASPALDLSLDNLVSKAAAIGQMRYKMWYVADVRTSAAYDEARSVAAALRIMGKPKRQARTKVAPPLRHWSGSKISNISLHLKTEAQILELLSASLEQGGPNKLSDEQARSTVQWMERNGIENLCRGEERLHRLCMEIRKCVDTLTSKESSFLASNPLFALENLDADSHGAARSPSRSLKNSNSTANYRGQLNLNANITSRIDGMTNFPLPLSNSSSRENLPSRSPTLTHRSSAPFWSPAITEAQSPSSATSIGSYHTQMAARSSPKKCASLRSPERDNHGKIEHLKQSLTGLLVSDMTALLFNEGCETDVAFWTGLGGVLIDNHFRSIPLDQPCGITSDTSTPQSINQTFDFESAFRTMLCSFTSASNPYTKIGILYDIDRLLPMYVNQHPCDPEPINMHNRKEVLGLGLLHDPPRMSKSDDNVKGFRRLFRDSRFRPTTIFRDLQYIAALLPSTTLETTPQGKAFWNAAEAISDVRQQACNVMVETADNIVAYHSNNRGSGRSSVAQQKRDSATFSTPSRSAPSEEISRYSMADAAYLLQITAKEGNPAAQRELATLYLTHPELMDHIIAPLSRPKDVFKEELEGKWRRNQDPNRCDPITMCVAHHWMTLSAKGGDALASAYLKQREEMDLLL